MNPPQNARERLGHCGIHKGHMRRNLQHILAHNAAGDADVFGISTVVEEQILAKIAAFLAAEKTYAARRGVRRHHTRAYRQILSSLRADLLYDSGEFVSKNGRRRDHPRMIATLPDLEIGAASQRDLYPHQRLVRRQSRNIDLLDLQVFTAVEHGGGHVPA